MLLTERTTPTRGPDRARRGRADRPGRKAALLLSPTFLVLALVVGYPLLAALRESLFRGGDELDESGFIVTGERFVGLDNYTAVFGEASARFWNAFANTTLFTVTTVAAEVVIGTAMAVVMHRAMRGRGLVRASILVPWAIPTAVAGLLWRWIFQADGVANSLLGTELLWTADGWPAKLAVIIADTWKTAPFVGLLVLAGLQLIPQDVHEAARLDGAGAWQQFWRVTLPLVKPALLVAVLFRLLDALRMFDLPFVLVGAQKGAVETLSMLAWDEANQVRYGPAAAYAVLLFLYVAVVAFVFVRLLGADLLGDRRARRAGARA
ncbi:carbohydrate ABC transporter membrane protein 1 (CUT1 family) [Prauserella shujinwangii]|uniref:Carbohydrate ABC transporter membrane protein 1 (CUT1 family) n=1 Tax=Prauserella shujinwangii TaxID=1453103 RepID=A0A2T0M1H0_9PSEU|nr:sugar ABC transporter permease [Prauserella shujinwangii]PRX50438.1 carbohydrate ABC transporter membrane protein 1 (CUT1 family) [Prauserella shujinwangii]